MMMRVTVDMRTRTEGVQSCVKGLIERRVLLDGGGRVLARTLVTAGCSRRTQTSL